MIRCAIFGHKPIKAYASKAAWVELSGPYHDGIGRAHRDAYGKCDRCGRRLLIAKAIDALLSKPGQTGGSDNE